MLRFFRASRSIQVGTPEVRARSPFSRGRALARSPIGRMRHPVYTKSRLSAAAESLLFGICIRKRYSASVLAEGQNLGAGGIHFRRACEVLTVSIKITTPKGVVIFMAGGNNSEPWIYKSLAPQRLQNSAPSLA